LYHKFLHDASLYEFLLFIDTDLARTARAGGCRCGGRLHSARYRRKPRGGPGEVDPEAEIRASFCCAVEGCRKRATPVSVRFLGRRVYWGAVVVLGTAMVHGVSPRRATQLRQLLGVSARALERWRRWWRESFIETSLWRSMGGRFVPPLDLGALPASLLERFCPGSGDLRSKLIATLRFLTPLTTSSSGNGAGTLLGR